MICNECDSNFQSRMMSDVPLPEMLLVPVFHEYGLN